MANLFPIFGQVQLSAHQPERWSLPESRDIIHRGGSHNEGRLPHGKVQSGQVY